MKNLNRFKKLATEQNNPATRTIDQKSIPDALKLINQQDLAAFQAARQALGASSKMVNAMVTTIKNGGRIFFVGAGTSGRLAVMEAAECPPTFNTPPHLIQFIMAGGRSSVFRSKEGAEDRSIDAVRAVNKRVHGRDMVIGIAASGLTPFVQAALKTAQAKKAKTGLITCSQPPKSTPAKIIIRLKTGPEVIAGSTRLKAATATKLVLNSLTVTAMIQLGKVFQNWMVDLQPKSQKLQARAIRLISLLGRVSPQIADQLLKKSNGQTKTAIVMARKKCDAPTARRELRNAQGHLHRALRGHR